MGFTPRVLAQIAFGFALSLLRHGFCLRCMMHLQPRALHNDIFNNIYIACLPNTKTAVGIYNKVLPLHNCLGVVRNGQNLFAGVVDVVVGLVDKLAYWTKLQPL